MTKHKVLSKELLGCLAVFGSAFFFYLSTVTIRWSVLWVTLDPAFFVFVRFLLGFVVICSLLYFKKQELKPVRYHFLVGRAVSNCVAVYCFYKGVVLTSVAEANILNMTYPLFIAVFS
ncbi:MAG TPA: EamA family transporter [Desulfobacterales bacterium]|nr:EamA family transporter [Desulfobacterales bacterium]